MNFTKPYRGSSMGKFKWVDIHVIQPQCLTYQKNMQFAAHKKIALLFDWWTYYFLLTHSVEILIQLIPYMDFSRRATDVQVCRNTAYFWTKNLHMCSFYCINDFIASTVQHISYIKGHKRFECVLLRFFLVMFYNSCHLNHFLLIFILTILIHYILWLLHQCVSLRNLNTAVL